MESNGLKFAFLTALITAPVAAFAQDVSVVGLTCQTTSAGPEFQGEIKNISSKPINHIGITATFRDAGGNLINFTRRYAKYNPLLPGQVSPFEGFGDANPVIVVATIVVDIGDQIAASSGKSSAPCR